MQLPLLPRVDFGGVAITAEFSAAWLQSRFIPAQHLRRDTVVNAVNGGNRRIDEARASIAAKMPVIGERRNGMLFKSAADQVLEQDLKKATQRQLVSEIARIKKDVDAVSTPLLKEMDRASATAKVLADRVFDKLSCLGRMKADGTTRREALTLRATCAALVANQEPIILRKMAQNAIDGGTLEDFVLIHAILNENLKHHRARQAFTNASLVTLVNPPEFLAASPLLTAVVDLRNEAFEAWGKLANHVGQVSLMRITQGLAKRELGAPNGGE